MRLSMLRWVSGDAGRGLGLVAAFAFSLGLAASAPGLQLNLAGDERINLLGGALPGTSYSTPATGADYDQIGGAGAHPGEVLITGTIPSLNYHTTGAPGTNVNFDFVPDLDFTLEAQLTGVSATPLGGNNFDITLTFGTTSDGLFDLIVTDPTAGNAVVFRADLTGGDFFGQPVSALEATGTNVDITTANPTFNTTAFLLPDATSTYGSLFTDAIVGLQFGIEVNWSPSFSTIASSLVGSGTLISHTSQVNGSIFGVTGAQFNPIPEPATGLLVGLGMVGIASGRRRRRR